MRNRKDYDDLTVEELEQELREAFFCSDKIDDTLSGELEELREALERKRPTEIRCTPQEAWERFCAENPEALESRRAPRRGSGKAAGRRRAVSPLFRRVLVVAAVVVLLAGAALAADGLGLVAWVPKWNASSGRYEPTVQEGMPERPIPAALAELGITEPVYPAKLPEGFVITESHISEDPLVLVEQFARGKDRLSITVMTTGGFRTGIYQKVHDPVVEYRSGSNVHFIFAVEGSITVIRYTENYATTISGDFSLAEMNKIIDSYYDEVLK